MSTLPNSDQSDPELGLGLAVRTSSAESPRVPRTLLDKTEKDVSSLNATLKDIRMRLERNQIVDLDTAKEYMKKIKGIQVCNTENMDTLAAVRKLIARDLEAIKRLAKRNKQP